jgi:hypothetical protein
MLKQVLTDQMVAVMRLVKEKGETVCAGTCEHRKPGELHCLTAAQILKCSTTGYKRRLRELVQMGYLDRIASKERTDRSWPVTPAAGKSELAKRSA